MQQYNIHPIVMGTKVFDKGMMTYQYDYGKPYTIPIYSCYIEGGDKKILVDTGEKSPICSVEREKSINGKIYTFKEGIKRWGLYPQDLDIIIHTHLHNDHCENNYKCVNATIYVHQKELDHIHITLIPWIFATLRIILRMSRQIISSVLLIKIQRLCLG